MRQPLFLCIFCFLCPLFGDEGKIVIVPVQKKEMTMDLHFVMRNYLIG